MPTATKTADRREKHPLFAKIFEFLFLVASTLLFLETREFLDAETSGDKSDAAYIHGL